jgi:hypothetical protein
MPRSFKGEWPTSSKFSEISSRGAVASSTPGALEAEGTAMNA